jgi:hypothetical protein
LQHFSFLKSDAKLYHKGMMKEFQDRNDIEDIYAYPRIPVDAYRKTFVHSLIMVPIRTIDPILQLNNEGDLCP